MVVRAGVGLPVLDAGFVEARAVRDVHLAADDRLHALLLHGVVELDRAEHVAVVGDGAGRHAQLGDALGQLLGPAGAVEEGVFGVEVEVNEGHRAFERTTTESRPYHPTARRSPHVANEPARLRSYLPRPRADDSQFTVAVPAANKYTLWYVRNWDEENIVNRLFVHSAP